MTIFHFFSIDGEEYCKVQPPEGGFWELGEWQDTDMDNPWDYGRYEHLLFQYNKTIVLTYPTISLFSKETKEIL